MGEIPESLFSLPSIKPKLFTGNKFSGHLKLIDLTLFPLTDLYLSNNQLKGPIPNSILRFRNIRYLEKH